MFEVRYLLPYNDRCHQTNEQARRGSRIDGMITFNVSIHQHWDVVRQSLCRDPGRGVVDLWQKLKPAPFQVVEVFKLVDIPRLDHFSVARLRDRALLDTSIVLGCNQYPGHVVLPSASAVQTMHAST